jgi:hypothetical protein
LLFLLFSGRISAQNVPEVTDFLPKSLCSNNELIIQGKNLDMIKGIQVGDNVVPNALFESNLTATLVKVDHLKLPNLTSGTYDLIISGDNNFRDTVGNLTVKVLTVGIDIADNRNTVCEGATVILQSDMNNVSYEWNTGETTRSIEKVITVETEFALTVTDADGCQAVAEQTVFTLPNPTASISVAPSPEICSGQEVTLTSSDADRYFWSTGDETKSIVKTPSETTTYELTVEGFNGCRTTTEVDIKVTPGPDVQISGPTEVCAGEPFTLTASGASSYAWHDGEMGPSINLSLDQDMTYSVTAKNADGCTTEESIDITVKPSPSFEINGPAEICPGQVVQLKVPLNQNWSYKWSQSAMGSVLSTVNIAPEQNTRYSVTVTDKRSNCSAEDSQEVLINNTLAFSIEGPDAVCSGSPAILSIVQNDDYEYKWSTGSNENEVTVSPTSSTVYSATVTDPTRGCTGIQSKEVKANRVIPKIHGPSFVCAGTTIDLRAGGGVSYQWEDGQTDDTITVTLTKTTDFRLTVTDALDCTADVQKRIEVYPTPTLEVDGNTEICSNQTTDLFLDTDVRDATITWTADGNLGSTSGSGPNGSMITDLLVNNTMEKQTTTYVIKAEAPNGCGSSETSLEVTVNPSMSNSLLPTETLSVLTGDNIDIPASVSSISWQPIESVGTVEGASPGNGDAFQQTLSLSSSKSWGFVRYQVSAGSGTGNNACASGTQFLDVKILPRSLVNNIFIPNLFTPNGDGVNDQWGIEYVSSVDPTQYSITVLSRNGGVVLPERSILEAATWQADGIPAGAYVYILKGPDMTFKGAITIQK